jgi:Co/Zn/Cd efflux system component
MEKSTFIISKMDCSSEEQMIKIKLQSFENIKSLQFDIPNRKLEVFHSGSNDTIFKAIDSLKLDTKLIGKETVSDEISITDDKGERKLFLWVFVINFLFFAVEIIAGLLSNSMSLVADSFDMLADALVFGISLFVVGKALVKKKQVAKISGYLQLTLAIAGIAEVIRRFVGYEATPDYKTMIIVASFTFIANALSLYLIQKAKTKDEVHIKAGKIFLANDVLISVGVIIAGIFVLLFSSKLPDLIVGSIVFIIVARGAFRILQLAK